MKKVLLALCILTAHNSLIAQIEKGNFLTGISGRYRFEFDDGKNYSLSLTPNIGYFMLNRLAAGASLSLNTSLSTGTYEQKNKSLAIGPFVRYYLLDNNKYNVFVQPSFLIYANRSTLNSDEIINYSTTTTAIALSVAPVYFINEHVSLGLLNNITKYYYESSNTAMYFEMQLGLQIHLRCKKKE